MTFWEYLHARSVRNSGIDTLIGRTQRSISMQTLWVIAGVLAALFFFPKIDPLVEKLLLVVLGALMSNWATQNGFWYGRPRGAGVPDPSTTTSTTTTTTPSPAVVQTVTTGEPRNETTTTITPAADPAASERRDP